MAARARLALRRVTGDRQLGQDYYRLLFEARISDSDTHRFLTLPESKIIAAKCAERFDDEVALIRRALETPANVIPAAGSKKPLKIALSNRSLRRRAGTELWVSDVARYLTRCGAEVIVYSPDLGPVSDELSESGITVSSSAAEVRAFSPDICFLHHFKETGTLVSYLAGTATKIVNMSHGPLPRAELPIPGGVAQYFATSITVKTMISLLTDADWNSIRILPNFFDETRFRDVRVSDGGSAALLYSNKASKKQIDALQGELALNGYAFRIAGQKSTLVDCPEEVLPQYDLVFAVGRSAIEALASGCAVILWDRGVVGPLVTPQNFWQCVCANFALTSMQLPYCMPGDTLSERWLQAQLAEISSGRSSELTQMVRKYLSLDNVGRQIQAVCNDALQ
jgi:hypothetical protein